MPFGRRYILEELRDAENYAQFKADVPADAETPFQAAVEWPASTGVYAKSGSKACTLSTQCPTVVQILAKDVTLGTAVPRLENSKDVGSILIQCRTWSI